MAFADVCEIFSCTVFRKASPCALQGSVENRHRFRPGDRLIRTKGPVFIAVNPLLRNGCQDVAVRPMGTFHIGKGVVRLNSRNTGCQSLYIFRPGNVLAWPERPVAVSVKDADLTQRIYRVGIPFARRYIGKPGFCCFGRVQQQIAEHLSRFGPRNLFVRRNDVVSVSGNIGFVVPRSEIGFQPLALGLFGISRQGCAEEQDSGGQKKYSLFQFHK